MAGLLVYTYYQGGYRAAVLAQGLAPGDAVQVDSTQPKGQVLGTVPQTGEITALDAPIQVQVSLGNQYLMPDLRGQFWTDAEPLLLSLGWQRDWTKLANAQNSGYPSNAVATQSPAPGTPVKFSDPITLSFAQ